MYKHNIIIEYILENIKNGTYQVGDKILTEKELAENLKFQELQYIML